MQEQEKEPTWIPETIPEPEPRTRLSRLIEILLWIMLVGMVAAVVIPELAGQPGRSDQLFYGLVGFALFPLLIARLRRAHHAWVYPIVGVLLFFVIPIVGGAKRGLEKRAQGNEVIAAMELFEPETARQARAVEKDLARVKPLIQGAMMRAAKRAPDAELVAYGDALFQLVETPTGINQPRCVSMATGGSKVPPTMAEEMHVAKATARLFRAAATQPVPVPIDLDRAMSLRDQALKAADPEGLISDPASFAAMPPDQQCGFYLRMMKALRQLPEKDAALILRFNMSQAG